ncbi:MAG: hypothetical protein PGN13_01400 [Patulibacter minatonensis]
MDTDRPQPQPGAAPPGRPPRVPMADAIMWGLGLLATVSAALVAGVGAVVLTTFGLGGVVLAAVAVLGLTGATIWRRGMLPLAVISVALAVPAAWAAHADLRIDRSRGLLSAVPTAPGDVPGKAYRRGIGDVLVDLRDFTAPRGSTTRIAARADDGDVVVALPQDRCFTLDVRFRGDDRPAPTRFALGVANRLGNRDGSYAVLSPMGLTAAAIQRESSKAGTAALHAFNTDSPTSPYGLLAFNRYATEAGTYTRRAAGEPDAPTLRLELRSTRQIRVRDYPREVDPMPVTFSQDSGAPIGNAAWPEGTPRPAYPDERSIVRSPANRATWIAWERRVIAYAKAQARRAAGPCASRADLEDRGFTFLTQPELLRKGGRTERLLGTGTPQRSSIPQRAVDAADAMLLVEVDGLGQTRLVNVVPHAGNFDDPELRR